MTAISQRAPQTLIEVRDGVPLIRGTTLSPYTIAALAGAETRPEIIGDYPHLSVEQIEAAVAYALVYPKPGRPLPSRSFKKMLADMAQAGVWDVEPAGDASGERAEDDVMP